MKRGLFRPSLDAVFAISWMAVLLFPAEGLHARQFRTIQPIASPGRTADALPEGAREVAAVRPVRRERLEPHLRKLFEGWEKGRLEDHLAEEFWDSQRLEDALDLVVPRDARLRLQSIQGVQTLSQYMERDSATGREKRVSIVSATVRSQLEFNDPQGGFVRRPGINELILKIVEVAVP